MDGNLRISIESGRGLLDARALWASIVGPQRLAMAVRRPVTLFNDRSALIAKNLATAQAYVFVGVALPFNAPTNPLSVVFGTDESNIGFNNGVPVQLTDNLTNWGFTQVLQPGEQIYAQIMTANVAPQVTQLVVVATEQF